jgi:hypothetical protein
MDGDVCFGTSSHLEDRRSICDDMAIRREELDHKFGFATRRFGNHEMQIADPARFQVPFRLPVGASGRQGAASWKAAYGDDVTTGNPISPVNGNWKGYLLTGYHLERSRRLEDWRRDYGQ